MVVIKNNNSKINSMFLWIMNLLFITFFLIWVSINWNSREVLNNYNARLFPWICGLIFVQMVSFVLKKVPFYDFGFWFVVISYPFMFGYLFRDVFELETVLLWNPIVSYENSELFHAHIFIMLSLELFSIGYLLAYRKPIALKKDDLHKLGPDKRLYYIGIILFLIGGISKLINDVHIISVILSANSYSAYSGAVSSGLWDDLAYLMLPGVFFIFFSDCIKERTKNTIFVIVLAYLVCMMMLTGSRKIQIFSILSIFLGHEFSLKKRLFSIKRIIAYAFLAIVTLNVLITIRDYRFDLASIVPAFFQKLFSFNLFENIIGETLAETGLTMLSIASIVKLVPHTLPYQYGLTYIRTLPSFLPMGWLVGDFFNLASSTYVVNSYTGIPVGSSFIGDLYWNWGYFGGVIAAFLFGVLICRFVNISSKYNTRKSCAMYFSIFSQLIILVRSELIDIYRPIIMLIIVVFVLEQFKINNRRVSEVIKNVMLHGATNFESSNYGDYIYGEMVYEYLKEKKLNVCFYQPSSYFERNLKEYSKNRSINKTEADLIIYIPGGYFGEGHEARFRDNLVQFIRFMPLGIWASYKKIPLVVLGIGAGPNNCSLMNFGIRRICNHSQFVTVRDKESYEALKKLCPKANIIESGDLIITRDLNVSSGSSQLQRIEQIKKNKKVLLVHYNHSKDALLKFASCVNKFTAKNPEYIVVVASDSILKYEEEYFKEFEHESGIKCEHFLYENPSEMTMLLKTVDVVLSCKLHVGVIACSFGKSVIAVACHPEKTARFYSQIGESGRCVSLFDVDSDEICELLEKYHENGIQIDEQVIKKSSLTWELLEPIFGE
jgi:polysaccharide pyruvyl transferase WcaK-like protein